MRTTKQYKGFTLVEMLIVMGILAILMTIGIAVGQFAIQRANSIQHQQAAGQLFQALQSYYTDNRKYPTKTEMANIGKAVKTGVLKDYIDSSFDGGAPTFFYYDVNEADGAQAFLICVDTSNDDPDTGMWCEGTGFDNGKVFGGLVDEKEVPIDATAGSAYKTVEASTAKGEWDGSSWK